MEPRDAGKDGTARPAVGHATLRLGENGAFDWTSGCHGLTGEYVVRGDTIELTRGHAIDSERVCSPETDTQDQALFAVLERGMAVQRVGDRLVLSSGPYRLTLRAG